MFKQLAIFFLLIAQAHTATLYVDVNATSPASPYTSPATATPDIQTAIDASAHGDRILVSDGLYQLASQLVISKDIVIESEHGPAVTHLIAAPGNRCVNMANRSAILKGFTVTGGSAGGYDTDGCGGGIYCSGTTPVIEQCILSNNVAASNGGALFKGTIRKSLICENRTSSYGSGGGLSFSLAENCTVVSNTAMNGAGVTQSTLYNTIVVGNELNRNLMSNPDGNLNYSTCYYSCSPALTDGLNGNISDDPLLNADFTLQIGSPCTSAGISSASTGGADLNGDYWGSPPSIGFDELPDAPLYENDSPTHLLVGHEGEFRFWGLTDPVVDLGDGRSITNMNPVTASWDSPGTYELIFSGHNPFIPASLIFTQTLTVATVENTTIHVSALHGNDANDGSDWNNALATLSSGVAAQLYDYGQVLVSNGVYQLGSGIELARPLSLVSVNGLNATVLTGSGSGSCLRLEDPEISVTGFTIQNGAGEYGGGVYCSSFSPVITDCLIQNNVADSEGGGVYKGTVYNSIIISNSAGYGGGVSSSHLFNSAVAFNHAVYSGGGAGESELTHCNVIGNTLAFDNDGPGVDDCLVRNSIVYYNRFSSTYRDSDYQTDYYNSCASDIRNPQYSGSTTNAPVLLDFLHIHPSSPCCHTGTPEFKTGVDIDQEAWTPTPSMGCDEPFGNFPSEIIPYVPPTYHPLTTSAANGSISQSPQQEHYLQGSTVALTVVPDPGYIFSGWSGDADGYNNPLNLLVDADKTVTANFKAAFNGAPVEAGELDWAASESNNGLGGFNKWSEQTSDFVAGGSALSTPAISSFENINIETYVTGPAVVQFHWKVGGTRPGRIICSVDGVNQTSVNFGLGWTEDIVTIPAGRHCVRWQTETLTSIAEMGPAYLDNVRVTYGDFVSLSVNQDTKGIIQTTPATNIFTQGTSALVEAVPSPGYEFRGWSGSYTNQPNPMTLIMDQPHRISATFDRLLDGEAVGLSYTKWYTGGVGEWKINDLDGGFVNGAVNGRGGTWIETTIFGPADLSFDWKFEPNREGADGLYIYKDGVQTKAANAFDWTPYSTHFSEGVHTFRVSFANFVDVNALNNQNVFLRNLSIDGPYILEDARPVDGATYRSPYFGDFILDENYPFILNLERGWQYIDAGNRALLYDYALEKWIWLDRNALPLARDAEESGHWFLYDNPVQRPEDTNSPPDFFPVSPSLSSTPDDFPSNSFVTATASGERIFTLWQNPEKVYEIQSSINLTNWTAYTGPQQTNGNVQTIELKHILTTNTAGFIRAEINDSSYE